MPPAEIGDRFRALALVGTVKAVRQEYEVYRTAGGDFVLLSPSNRGSHSFHMTLVTAEMAEAVSGAMGREPVTTASLMKDESLDETLGGGDKGAKRFDVLMSLYVLVASGRVDMEKAGRSLVFTKLSAR